MTRGRLLAMVTLAILAGCGGLTSGDDGGGDAPTLTPAAVPGEDVPINSGPAGTRLEATRIVDAHRETLANASHTVVERLRVGPTDDASYDERTVLRRAAGGVPYHVNATVDVDHRGVVGRGTDVFWNGETAYYRYAFDVGRETYYQVPEEPSPRLAIDGRFRPVLDALRVSRVGRSRDGSLTVGGYVDDGASCRGRDT